MLTAQIQLLVVVVVGAAGRKVAQIFLLMPMLVVNLAVKQVQALAEHLTHRPQPLAEQQLHHQLAAEVAVQRNQPTVLLAVLVHSLLVVAVAVVLPAPASWVELVALAVQDMWRSTHGKFVWHNRRWCGR